MLVLYIQLAFTHLMLQTMASIIAFRGYKSTYDRTQLLDHEEKEAVGIGMFICVLLRVYMHAYCVWVGDPCMSRGGSKVAILLIGHYGKVNEIPILL